MVLVHGITDDGLCWVPVARALPPDYDLILMDMRGHGESDAPQDGGYTLDNMASELAACIRSLQLKKPILLGHSMGAFITLLLGRDLSGYSARDHPGGSASVLETQPSLSGS